MIAENSEKDKPGQKSGLSKLVLLAGGLASTVLLVVTLWGLDDPVAAQEPALHSVEFLSEIEPATVKLEETLDDTGRALGASQ